MPEHKPMSPGERQVWAVSYVAYLKENLRSDLVPEYLYKPGKEKVRHEWTRAQMVSAVEQAWWAVDCMRKIGPHVEEDFGEDSDVLQYLNEMLDDGGECK
jgi:hypothetical protein